MGSGGGIVFFKCTFGLSIEITACPFIDTLTKSLDTGECPPRLWIGVRRTMSLIITLQSSVLKDYNNIREHMDKLGLYSGRTIVC